MLEARRARTALIRRQPRDGFVEAGVRFVPVEQAEQVIAKRVGHSLAGRQPVFTRGEHTGLVSMWMFTSFFICVGTPSRVAGL